MAEKQTLLQKAKTLYVRSNKNKLLSDEQYELALA